MNYNDIAAMLAAGKTSEEIAKEFTDALNKATAEQRAKEEAKAKEEANSKAMDAIAEDIAQTLNSYLRLAGVEFEDLTGKDVRDVLDEVLPLIENLKNIKVHVAKTTPKIKEKIKSADDVFDWFFKEMNW